MKKWQYKSKTTLENTLTKSQKAFTLIELLIVIAITAMIISGAKLLNFNKISNEQRLDTKIVHIISQIEEIRNNSLLGRGIGTNLEVPKKYQIEFSTNGSGIINTKYLSGAVLIDYNYFNKKIKFGTDFEKISKINCLNLDKTVKNNLSNTETGILTFEGANISLTGSCSKESKILELQISKKSDTKKIHINILNGLIEILD